jgi:hypothetical protein
MKILKSFTVLFFVMFSTQSFGDDRYCEGVSNHGIRTKVFVLPSQIIFEMKPKQDQALPIRFPLIWEIETDPSWFIRSVYEGFDGFGYKYLTLVMKQDKSRLNTDFFSPGISQSVELRCRAINEADRELVRECNSSWMHNRDCAKSI